MRGPFLAALEDNCRERIVLLTPTSEVSVEHLCSEAREIRRLLQPEYGPGLFVSEPDVLNFLKLLLALDGVCKGFHIGAYGAEPHPEWQAMAMDRYAGAAHQSSTAWFISTSGTTGSPKLIRHCFETLTSSTKPWQPDAPPRRWGLLYDHSRFAGLQVVLQALLGGGTLCAAPLHDLAGALRFYSEAGVTSLSATPTLWRKILMIPAFEMPSLRQITLGGEIVDQALLDALALRFKRCSIRHIYASTEAGVGFSVADGRAGFPSSYLTGANDLGISMHIGNNSHLLIERAGAALEAVERKSLGKTLDEVVDTGDLVEQRGDRVFFLGRDNGSINVGGNKVYPETIEQILCTHKSVVAARVYALRSSLTGNLVAADIVPREAPDAALQQDLRAWCAQQLLPWQRPVRFKFVEDVPLSAAGKISRIVT